MDARAKTLATRIAGIDGIRLDPASVETNIVIFKLDDAANYAPLAEYLDEHGVRVTNLWDRAIRLVTHRSIDDASVEAAVSALASARAAGVF